MNEFIVELPLSERVAGLTGLFVTKPEIELQFDEPDYEFLAWGDPIGGDAFRERLSEKSSPEFIVTNLYGHYYFIYLNKKSGDLVTGNSLFSILPLYYHCCNEKITISGNALTLGNYLGSDKVCKRFILETILFNYPLFNNSIFQDIELIPANTCIIISNHKFSLQKHTETVNFFGKELLPWKEAIKTVPDRFLETTYKYLPSEHYASALTGGFDSRTLVSAGLFFNRDFSTYSFGTETSKDVTIAGALSAAAGLQCNKIVLGEEYIKHKSLECGKEFILNSSGAATFARAHYLYAAKKLSSDFGHILTGNFGSELFRAMHITGVVISENLFSLFNSEATYKAFRSIEASEEYRCLAKESFNEEWKSLKAEILGLSCFSPDYSGMTMNQRFYVFVFEEIFRKYFGAEMVNQFRYMKNRTPYLDIDFLKTVFQTELAGIYSDFFEHNPLKRYRGQVLYAHIIRKSYPSFGKTVTDKGYKPDDLINFSGKINITRSYLKKKIRKLPSDTDPNSVARAWEANRNYWTMMPISKEFFAMNKFTAPINKEILNKVLSLSFLINFLSQKCQDASKN